MARPTRGDESGDETTQIRIDRDLKQMISQIVKWLRTKPEHRGLTEAQYLRSQLREPVTHDFAQMAEDQRRISQRSKGKG